MNDAALRNPHGSTQPTRWVRCLAEEEGRSFVRKPTTRVRCLVASQDANSALVRKREKDEEEEKFIRNLKRAR